MTDTKLPSQLVQTKSSSKELIALISQLSILKLENLNLIKLPSEIWQLTKLNSLDLRGNKLTELPAEIGLLTKLNSLDLRDNRDVRDYKHYSLTNLPSVIGQLTNLTNLDLSYNNLSQLPAELWQLTKLNSLDLSKNGLTDLPSLIGQLTNLTSLDLSENYRMKELPAEIGQLTKLNSLGLSHNSDWADTFNKLALLPNLTSLKLDDGDLTQLPAEIGQLTNLTSLDLRLSLRAIIPTKNNLTELPSEIGQLTNLTELNLNYQMKELPAELWQLTNLTSLNLNDNRLTSLPVKIRQLAKLTSLHLSSNNLRKLPSEIGQLTSLTELNLGGGNFFRRSNSWIKSPNLDRYFYTYTQSVSITKNNLTELPSEIGQLTKLTHLNLSGNELYELPAEIGQLASLTSLDLNDNRLTSLPAEIGQLTNLTELNLRYNRGLDWTDTFNKLALLPNLTSLDLSQDYRMKELPAEIGQLTNLTSLDLSYNNLSQLPASIGQLTNLISLDLSYSKLSQLPAEIGQLTNLTILNLRGTSGRFGITEPEWGSTQTNSLRKLPAEIGQLTNLTKLDLFGNNFKISDRKLNEVLYYFQLRGMQQVSIELKELYIASFFEDFNRVKTVIEQLTDEQLFNCLDIESENTSALILAVLGQRFNPLAESIDLSGSVFHFAGRFTSSISVKEMKSWLQSKGARVVSRLSNQVTHFVVGQGKGQLALSKLNSSIQLVFPQNLQQLVERIDQPLLLQETEEQAKLIDNLKQLLTSAEISNVKVGLLQMAGNGVPNELMAAVLSFYLYHPDKDFRQIASQAFQKYAPIELRIHVRSTWKAVMRDYKDKSDTIERICENQPVSDTQMLIWVDKISKS